MGDLGNFPAVGVLSTLNKITRPAAGWVITWKPEMMPNESTFEVWHASIRGPGGYFEMWIDESLYSVGQNGRINVYSPATAAFIRKGQTITLHWSIGTGAAPRGWLYFRTPEVGRL